MAAHISIHLRQFIYWLNNRTYHTSKFEFYKTLKYMKKPNTGVIHNFEYSQKIKIWKVFSMEK